MKPNEKNNHNQSIPMKTLKFLLIAIIATLSVACGTIDIPVQTGRPMPMLGHASGFNSGNGYRPPGDGMVQPNHYNRGQYGGRPNYGGPSYGGRPNYGNGPNGAGQTIYHGFQGRHVYGSGPQTYADGTILYQ